MSSFAPVSSYLLLINTFVLQLHCSYVVRINTRIITAKRACPMLNVIRNTNNPLVICVVL
ncbi:hypothetical protein T492DRAFT_923309 [Pavlovales sp. CCMP2436]|nr:hypothetical protein T492DRAFT_923309 [Pavlovales sp. CCMP2436]